MVKLHHEHYVVKSADDDETLAAQIQAMIEAVWPRFVTQSSSPKNHPFVIDWMGVYRRWPQYQLALFDARGELIASANGLAFGWSGDTDDLPDEGWEWAMHQALIDYEAGVTSQTMVALGVQIRPDARGQNLSRKMLELLRQAALHASFQHLIVPVRPNLKARYPITSIEQYLTWTNGEGLPFDPWLRVHARLGARMVKPCHRSMLISGSVKEWEEWTGLQFPTSGDYVAPDLLVPLRIDRDADVGLYIEPNVWVVHELAKDFKT